MKRKLLAILLFMCVTAMSYSQSRMILPKSKALTQHSFVQRTSPSFQTNIAVCDTITNFLSTYSYYLFPLGKDSGYVSGQNIYKDVSKAERFVIPSPNTAVIGVAYFFGLATTTNTGQTFNARVWDNDGVGGIPKTVLGSQAVKYDTAAAKLIASLPTVVAFSPNIFITDTVYAGVNFGYHIGDSIAIINSGAGEPTVNTAWEQWSDNTWNSYPASWGPSVIVANLIYLFVCDPTGVQSLISPSGNIAVMPNPSSTGNFSVIVPDQDLSQPLSISVYNATGSLVYNSKQLAASNLTYHLNLADVSKGIYLLKVVTSKGVKTQKLVVE